MSSSRVLHWDYSRLTPLLLGFSSAASVPGVTIRTFTAGPQHAFNRKIPNHVFLVTEDWSQFFATEQTFRGLVPNSLEQYTKEEFKQKFLC
jgi:hypothetical protein